MPTVVIATRPSVHCTDGGQDVQYFFVFKKMQSLLSLEGYDPELQHYLREHRWPETMEVSAAETRNTYSSRDEALPLFTLPIHCWQALLTGLTVMLPLEPWEFVADKLRQLKEARHEPISWSENLTRARFSFV